LTNSEWWSIVAKSIKTVKKMAINAKRRAPGKSKAKGWEPTPRQAAWHHEWSVLNKSYPEIAKESKVSRQAVFMAVRKVDDYLRTELIDDVIYDRRRMSAAIEQLVAEAIGKWKETFNVEYLRAALSGMSDYRKMWGTDKPTKIAIENTDSDGLERVDGKSRAEALRDQAAAMMQRAQELGGAKE
jgi:predicted DNA-binding protein YlxM (UPF0122 family)